MRGDLELLQCGQSVKRRRLWQQCITLGKKLAIATSLAVLLLASLLYSKSQLIPRTYSGQNHGTKNLDALNAYQMGLNFGGRQNQAGLTNAIAYFEKAVAIDPRYAEAWTLLAWAYNYSADWDITEPRDSKPKARAAALKALELDKSQQDAYTELAAYKATYE